MRRIINEELETLRLSKQYIFSDKNFPNQVFRQKFDMYIFMEDVHIKANEFFQQFKMLEHKIGGQKIYLHTVEPYLEENEQSEVFVKDFFPPCLELKCDEVDSPNEIWGVRWENGDCYDWNRIQIVFGEKGEWGCFFSTMYDEYGVIGVNNSIIEEFKDCVPYVLEKCFDDMDNLLQFVEWLSRNDTFPYKRDSLLKNYVMSPELTQKIYYLIYEAHNG
jgi:hypothetical protein